VACEASPTDTTSASVKYRADWRCSGQPPHNRTARSQCALGYPRSAHFHLRNWPVTDVSADLISALAIGTHLDIAATDQIRPIATTTAIPIPARICIPLCVALSLAISG
jgi:hypothetical protein